MTKIVRAGQVGALDHIDSSQAVFREQIAALTDAVRQLGGNAEIAPGSARVNDPLSAPFVLYVNGYTGSDKFVSGDYASADGGTFADKVKRISYQRLECGYSPARPFKTLNRAVIEAAIITSRDYMNLPGAPCGDLVSIIVAPGITEVLNGPGGGTITEWVDGKEPTTAELQAFNSARGGVILPRGCSVCSLDLRKTIIRPTYVPAASEETADLSNRSAIFRMTGGGYYYGLTFMDKDGLAASHHLLDCFAFASKADLDAFYGKIRTAFDGTGKTGKINPAIAVARDSEWKIVGTFPAAGQTADTDTTRGASPYVYNCSARSMYGLCGVLADGADVDGLRSVVLAQFTGVSLQRDLSCWQKHSGTSWGAFTNYQDYIDSDPDSVRMNPKRRSYHIRAVNDAIIQEVSVFAIGQGVHHWVQKGGEITITNSNSNFGGCAALAEDYKTTANVADKSWTVNRIRVATDLSEENGNITKIYLGNIADGQTDAAIQAQRWFDLRIPLEASLIRPTIPEVIDAGGYTLREQSYLWIENPSGEDYRVRLPATAWDPTSPARLNFINSVVNEKNIAPGDPVLTATGVPTGQNHPSLAGRRVYIRRLKDSRKTEERRYSLVLNNTTAASRIPLRDYVLQTDLAGTSVNGLIPNSQLLTVMATGGEAPSGPGVLKTANISLRRNNASSPWTAGQYYRPGDNVTQAGKHYICVTQNNSLTFVPADWREAFVHMETTYNNEDFQPNSQPSIIFDNDSDGTDASTTLGYNLSTVWANDPLIRDQYRSATDYQGLHSLLVSFGFSTADAHKILLPKTRAQRDRNPGTALDGIGSPGGAVKAWANWPVEFRRPSNIRLFGHAYEWAGYLNYTKSLPRYQRELGVLNKFTYYFTHKDGGRVYASGFNEEGFLVTNKGLEDLASGNSLTVDQLGSEENSIDFPTFFESLSANDLTVNNTLTISGLVQGNATWTQNPSYLDGVNKESIGPFGEVLPALPRATTSQRGVIELATADEVRNFTSDTLAVTPATLIAALGDSLKSVVNARLSLSPTSSVPNGNQSGGTLYLHPYNGNEIALYSVITLRWSVIKFSGVQSFSLASLAANANYDIYVYNSGTATAPALKLDFVAWSAERTPPPRLLQDGVLTKNNKPDYRFMGVIRTTGAGQSIVDLGGVIAAANQANYPRMFLANRYNLYDVRTRYFFGTGWNAPNTSTWSVPPPYAANPPRCAVLQASSTLVTAFLDIYGNHAAQTSNSIAYVAPGINSTSGPPDDAFYGETQSDNATAGSQWAQSLGEGLNSIYYLFRQLNSGSNNINEHASHGMIVISKA